MHNLELSQRDRAMLAGDHGPGTRMAMEILARMAPVFGADRLLDISLAHIDSSVYMGPATLAFAERLADDGAKVAVPSTLNVAGVDAHGWDQWDVPEDWATGSRRQMDAYESMGCIPTWTCAPYQTEYRPQYRQQVAAGESNAISFFNSVIGARTERYPDLLDICCAIAGRAPAAGLHTDEGRRADLVLEFEGVPHHLQTLDVFYPVLGQLLGREAGSRIALLKGLDVEPTDDQYKAMCAGGASSGAVALFHWEGVTPESREGADILLPDAERRVIRMDAVRSARKELSTSANTELDTVLLGSPHFSVREFQRLATLVAGRTRHPDVQVLVTCSRAVRETIDRMGVLGPLKAFGVRLTVDTCPLVSPMLPAGRSIMTNSAKYAYYSPGLLKAQVAYGSLEDCVESAVAGTVKVEEGPWQA